MSPSDRQSALAAAIILLVAGLLYAFLPRIMLFLGGYSPWIAAVFGALAVLAFFAVFWLRARAQHKK